MQKTLMTCPWCGGTDPDDQMGVEGGRHPDHPHAAPAAGALAFTPRAGERTRYALGVGRTRALIGADTIEAARATYCRLRDESGLGCSKWPEGVIYDLAPATPKAIAIVSYNGRLWEVTGYATRKELVFKSIGGAR